jgi:hypothetical protein
LFSAIAKRQSVFSQLRRTNDTYSKLEGIT